MVKNKIDFVNKTMFFRILLTAFYLAIHYFCAVKMLFSIVVLSLGLSLSAHAAAPGSRSDEEVFSFMNKNGIAYDSLCTNMDLYKEIMGWMGVRYKYAGKSKKGVDCSGFVGVICNKIYGTQLGGSAGDHFKKCVEIDRNQLEEGDLVFFKIRKNTISHVGLYLGNHKFIHAAVHGGVMINDLRENYYNKYYFSSGRLKS